MMNIKKAVYLLKDANGVPVFTLNGTQEFCFKSFGNSLCEEFTKNMPDEIVKLLKGGSVDVLAVYIDSIHDNDPKLNRSHLCSVCDCSFSIYDLAECKFEPDKKFSKKYHNVFKSIDGAYKCCEIFLKNLNKELEENE